MANWLGYGTLPKPAIPPSARSAIASTLAAVDGQRAGTLSPEPLATALVFEKRCVSCHALHGIERLYIPVGAAFSARSEVLCPKSDCRRMNHYYMSDAGVSAHLPNYDSSGLFYRLPAHGETPRRNGRANGYRNGNGHR